MAAIFWTTSYFLEFYLLLFAFTSIGIKPHLLDASLLTGCRDSDIDLLMVADGDISMQNHQIVFKEVLRYFLSPEEDLLTRLKVALVVASPEFGPVLSFPFGTHNSSDDLKREISEMKIGNTSPASGTNVSQFSVQQTLDFVCSLVSDIQGGRKNSTRVAVVVVGTSWPDTLEEIRDLHATKNAECNVRIFLILVGFNLKDSIKLEIAQSKDQLYWDELAVNPALPAKLCNECYYSWSMWHDSMHSLRSCYTLSSSMKYISWMEASNYCETQGGRLASIETQEELLFVSSKLIQIADQTLVSMGGIIAFEHVHIGLTRDSNRIGSPFMWVNGNPLIYMNWGNGLPQEGTVLRCGVWVFKRGSLEATSRPTTAPSTMNAEIENSWLDVGCGFSLTNLALCEIVIENTRFRPARGLRISPASSDSILQAKSRGEFTIFQEKLMSMSVHPEGFAYATFLEDAKLFFKVFDCMENDGETTKIPYSYVCDHIRHCENGRDETICQYPECDQNNEFTCHSLQCVPLESRCDVYRDCYDGSDEENCDFCNAFVCCDGSCLPRHFVGNGMVDCNGCNYGLSDGQWMIMNDEIINSLSCNSERNLLFDCPFICNRSECVYTYMLNDGVTDCLGPEGPLDETIGKLETSVSCDVDGYFKYVRWSPRCVYVKDRFGAVLGCRNMSHLHDCQDFICPEGYVKCPDSYCVALHHVGDGVKDCPFGEDEWDLGINCMGNFACWGGKVCVHPDQVCDGHPHCPSGDDELNCHVSCADGFQCLAGTVTVAGYDTSKPLQSLSFIDARTRYVDLSGIDLSASLKHEDRGQFISVLELYLSNCNLKFAYGSFVVDVRNLDTVYTLDLSHNRISSITADNMFRYMTNLHVLDLSHNQLLTSLLDTGFYPPHWNSVLESLNLAFTGVRILKSTSLLGLSNLKHLNLSNTQIDTLDKNTFPENFSLRSLDLRDTYLSDIQPSSLRGLSVSQHLYSDLFKLCCPQVRGDGIADSVCHAPPSAVSSCLDLVHEPVQRVLLWTVGALAIVANAVVIFYRFMYERHVLKKPYGFFVTNLSASDLLMGIYLLIIASTDVIYRGEYVWHERNWRDSGLCQAAGFLSTISSETSAFFILLITIDRFLVIRFPFGQINFSKKSMILSCVVAWSIGFVLALIPILPTFTNWEMYSSNGMCLGLLLTPERRTGWEYSVSVFIILNFLLFVFIACGQYLIYRAMSENSLITESETQKNAKRVQEIMVAKQLSLVALSDFLCWFPIGLMGLLALSGYDVGTEAYAWSAVLVLPINSALNPVLYTVPRIIKKWEDFKSGTSRPLTTQPLTTRTSTTQPSTKL